MTTLTIISKPDCHLCDVAREIVDVVGGGNWDVALVADFADRAGLDAYQTHPDHQAVAGYIRSVVSDRVAVDFEV